MPSGAPSQARQLQRAPARDAREHGRKQVVAAGRVEHASAGLVDERPREGVAHPVLARHPAPVVAARGALETRAHGEQMVDRDRANTRIGVLRHEISSSGAIC